MKKLFNYLLLTLLSLTISNTLLAQNPMNTYEKEWEEIKLLEIDEKTKTCLEKVQVLYEKIKKDTKNPVQNAQLIKALLYINKYMVNLEEDGLVKAIYRFETETEKATGPIKSLLESMLAELYDQFLFHNLYKFSYRTEVLNVDNKDIRTWDVQKITNKCHQLYLSSVKNEIIKQTSLSNYGTIINGVVKNDSIYNTLFDFLAHRAIDFFMSEKSYLTQPAYKFYIDKEEYFAKAESFINLKIEAKDISSSHYQALLLLQKLLAYNIVKSNPQAFLFAEFKRLDFVRKHSIMQEKDELYYKRLEDLTVQYANRLAVSEAWYKIALFHKEKGDTYKPSPLQENRWELKKAIEICNKTIEKYPNSYGSSNCKALISRINEKSMSLKIEQVNSVAKPILSLFEYKNLKKVNFRIVSLNEKQYRELQYLYYEDKLNYLNKLTALQKWSVDLPDEVDYQTHSTELKVPALSVGFYAILCSEREDFAYKSNAVAYTLFHVSDISYMNRNLNGMHEYYVCDRNSGKPLKGVEAKFYYNIYNSLTKNYEWNLVYTEKTDENGYIKTKLKGEQNYGINFRVTWSYDKDNLSTYETFYNVSYEKRKEERITSHFFIDRAIYRPGQTVYFKGIAVKTDDSKPKQPVLEKNYSTTVVLYDANYQEVARTEVVSNEYGSFQGSFTLPSTGRTGQMHLQDIKSSSYKYFSVEEYKRPKFEVSFKPLIGSFKIDEKVKVTGSAMAFAGYTIDGAKVNYRVVRKTDFPYWKWWYWGWYNPYTNDEQEIKFGEIKTDANGEFNIEFIAIADKSVPKDRQPVFSYTIYADVIDISGETRSSSTTLRVGYVALDASMKIPGIVEAEKVNEFNIYALNLNAQPEKAKGTIKIEKLSSPTMAFKDKYWEKADYFAINKTDYYTDFPNYAYSDEDEQQKWPVEKEMLNLNFDTEKSDKLPVDMKNWSQGKYKVTLKTSDKFGTEIEQIYYFTLFSNSLKNVPLNEELFNANTDFKGLEPDTTIEVEFGSFNNEAWVLMEIEHESEIISRKWVQPKGRIKIPVKIEEKHRGNFSYHLSSIQFNRDYHSRGRFFVPWSNKELNIEFSTFREKLYPGQPEEWRVKISGPKKEKVAAEYLATMYDASLDAFSENYWSLDIYPSTYMSNSLEGDRNFTSANSTLIEKNWNKYESGMYRTIPYLNWFDFNYYESNYYEGVRAMKSSGRKKDSEEYNKFEPSPISEAKSEETEGEQFATSLDTATLPKFEDKKTDFGDVKVRSNLNETVFFFPQLLTDENGDIILKFKMNEALTKWKFMSLAHTTDLKIGTAVKEVITQKELMVVPNAPRFFRQGDKIFFSAKVSNMTEKPLSGKAVLQLFDAVTMQPIDKEFTNNLAEIDFATDAKRSAPLSWQLNIPKDWTNAVTFRVIAKSDAFSDGEESSLPVLTNSMLVTETMPLPIRGGQSKTFNFSRMKEATKSNTLRHHKFTLEFTQNPAWYAIQSLPYLMEYPYECTEQIFSRYYANSLATEVANSHPKVKRVFDQWKNIDTEALKSNLSKNQELKYALLEETPWVLDAQSEEQQKKNIGLLFDLNRMSAELNRAIDKMTERQLSNGGFSWFPGGIDSWYITQYIVEGMGHLNKLGVKNVKEDAKIYRMLKKAVEYCDAELVEMYNNLLKDAKNSPLGEKKYLELDHLNSMAIHFLYARSFFPEIAITNKAEKAIEYYEGQAAVYWNQKSMYMKGLLALGLNRKGKDLQTPSKIITGLRENSLYSEEMGMYWKYTSGYFWYEAPIETHALMIEVFDEVAKDSLAVDNLKVWLLKNKQTSNWKTTKATASAVYALLLRGDNWLMDDKEIDIELGNEKLDQSKIQKEAGTGYFKTSWNGKEIKSDWSNIKVSNPNKVVAWGAAYWQYFEQLDKITHFQETPLKIDKKLFKQVNTDRGPKLEAINNGNVLKPGDLVKVRIEIRVDRDMEYVHMKDMRASGFEPVNVLSQYKYQGGLGYYESTKDAATNFFMDYLSKGTYVFEYDLRVNHKGDFSNGITTLQCMYAPEFTSHSEGIRVKVD